MYEIVINGGMFLKECFYMLLEIVDFDPTLKKGENQSMEAMKSRLI